jgi:hypothetical protein
MRFRDQRVQRDQQIQVDGGEIHGVDFENSINRLDESIQRPALSVGRFHAYC